MADRDSSILIYGSNGYSGNLIALRALEQGLRPILAGRNALRVTTQAEQLGLDHRIFELADRLSLDEALQEVDAVLHCAGPYASTWRPMAEACLRTGTHYLDITGEIGVFERLAALDAAANARRITLLPGVGFDVVATDCLALHLKQQLPSATRLALAFRTLGRAGFSRGTANTAIEGIARGGAVRQSGKVIRVPHNWKARRIDFGRGPERALTLPWGDISTAFYSTGIPNIENYWVPPMLVRRLGPLARWLTPLLGFRLIQGALKRLVQAAPAGPNAAQRKAAGSIVWGEVVDPQGNTVSARLEGPEVYTWTAWSAVEAAKRVLAGEVEVGFQTPATAFGPDFALQFRGVRRTDAELRPAPEPVE
jgi:short subunit dehydrogenase-like uncharacterized protein